MIVPLLLEDSPNGQDQARPECIDAAAKRGRSTRWFVCARCGGAIAPVDAERAVGTLSRHVFANPAGRVFALVTVAEAPGAAAVGAPTLEYTWFSGCAWCVAVCRGCRAHVGWRFDHAGARGFWGLWLDALQQAGSGRGDSASD